VKTHTCRSCGRPIRWVQLPSGKRMPLDALPPVDGRGNVFVHSDGRRGLVLKEREIAEQPPAVRKRLYLSHFASCAQADQHRRPEAKEGAQHGREA
jgi:hypothetical protein